MVLFKVKLMLGLICCAEGCACTADMINATQRVTSASLLSPSAMAGRRDLCKRIRSDSLKVITDIDRCLLTAFFMPSCRGSHGKSYS